MHTENPRVLKNLINKHLSPYITEYALEIPEWKSYTGKHVEPNVIVRDDSPETVMRMGDRYNVGYDDTRYFEAEITVPDVFEGRKAYLTIDFGGEAIIRINGKIAGAVSSRENGGWVCRNDILFPEGLKAGEKLFIQCENTVDCGSFCDHAMAGEKYMTYTLSTAALRLINEEAEALYYDMTCAWEVYENTEDKYVAKRLYNAVDSAMHKLCFDLGKEKFYASVPAAREYFYSETAKIKAATPGDVILAGHSHLDIAWLWTVRELNRKTARTFSNNLALMDVYPDFKFTQSQALVYQFMKDRYPEIYERVKEKVRSGQWEITGNTWVEADTNIASGESLIRQLLYGREFFMKEFGVSSDIYWLPDCFGFTAALPQIIKKSGMKYFVTSKLQNNDTNEFPVSVFKWRSHSGDEILAYMQKVSYNGEADAAYIVRTRATNRQNDLVDASLGMYGYGDGGGGCTYNMFERLRRMEKLPGLPSVRPGTAAEFFAGVEKAAEELPVWDGEMYYENHRGTYTSHADVKRNNRRGEYALRELEMLSLLNGGYKTEEMEKLWKVLLQNQFHDILPGTSIHEVFENTAREYAELFAETGKLTAKVFEELNNRYASDGGMIVWNFHSHPVTGSVEIKADGTDAVVVTDIDGNEMISAAYERDGGRYISFIAENVPGLGYKLFFIKPGKKQSTPAVICTERLLENEYLRAIFDENGLIISLYDKENEKEILTGRGNLLTLSHDKPIHESAWNLESDYKMQMKELTALDCVEVIRSDAAGELMQVRSFNSSVITQYISLEAGSRVLKFRTVADWHEKEKVLKAQFPVDIRARNSVFEIAHGAIQRPTYANNSFEKAMFECCAHKWTDLSDNGYGVSLLNDCKYGYDLRDNLMRITLMRAPVCPDTTADIGVNTFCYALYPHAGTWSDADTVNEAFKLNLPLKVFTGCKGSGKAGERSFISVSGKGVIVDAVKQAQNGSGVILRVYEAEGKREKAVVTLPAVPVSVSECNMMEEDIKLSEFDYADGFRFTLKPFEVKTFRIIF